MNNNWRRTIDIYTEIDTRPKGTTISDIAQKHHMNYKVAAQLYYDFLNYAKKTCVDDIYTFLCELEKVTSSPLRVYKALNRAGVVKLNDLLTLTDDEIMDIPQIGVGNKKSLIVMKQRLIYEEEELKVPIVFYRELYLDLSAKADEFGVELNRFVQQMAYLGLQQISKTEVKEVVK